MAQPIIAVFSNNGRGMDYVNSYYVPWENRSYSLDLTDYSFPSIQSGDVPPAAKQAQILLAIQQDYNTNHPGNSNPSLVIVYESMDDAFENNHI